VLERGLGLLHYKAGGGDLRQNNSKCVRKKAGERCFRRQENWGVCGNSRQLRFSNENNGPELDITCETFKKKEV